jgi:hypothetical protein
MARASLPREMVRSTRKPEFSKDQLHTAKELQLFYNLEIRKGILVTADFQEGLHPAYNADRGPCRSSPFASTSSFRVGSDENGV